MTIEFQCDGCLKTLRTADDKAGRTAKCPQCGKTLTVPAPMPVEFEEFQAPSAQEPARTSHLSDFEELTQAPPRPEPVDITCPMCGEVNESTTDRCLACGEPLERFAGHVPGGYSTRFSDVWSRAWALWAANIGINIAAIAIAGVVLLGSYMLCIGLVCAGVGIGAGIGVGERVPTFGVGAAVMLIAVMLAYFQIFVVLWLLQIGLSRFGIDNARRENPMLGVMFDFSGRILASVVCMIPYAIAFMIILTPAMALVFVGVYQMEMHPQESLGVVLYLAGLGLQMLMSGVATGLLWPIPYMLADRSSNLYGSLIDGPRMAISNMQLSVLLGLTHIGLWLVGSFSCGIGLLFTFSLGFVLFAVAYEHCRLSLKYAHA